VITILKIQAFLCLVAATYGTVWNFSYRYPYLHRDAGFSGDSSWENNKVLYWLKTGGTWLLLFANFIPISLLVTLELVKFFQGMFMEWEYRMYHEQEDQPAEVQACNLNEELGQVEYVFSDKTGTLTCNQMIFRKFSAGLQTFGAGACGSLRSTLLGTESGSMVMRVLQHMTLCHSIIIDLKTGSFSASSPDELAIIKGADELGA
jgi:phospholipid-transporting ATPase